MKEVFKMSSNLKVKIKPEKQKKGMNCSKCPNNKSQKMGENAVKIKVANISILPCELLK